MLKILEWTNRITMTNEPTNTPKQSHSTLPSRLLHNPYLGLPVIGNSMIGIVLKIDEGRAVKKAKQYQLGQLRNHEDVEYIK